MRKPKLKDILKFCSGNENKDAALSKIRALFGNAG
jgi:hypothetical protein